MANVHVSPVVTGFGDRSVLSLATLVSRLIAWNDARRTRIILSRLSAHELNDIGLTRGDIDLIR